MKCQALNTSYHHTQRLYPIILEFHCFLNIFYIWEFYYIFWNISEWLKTNNLSVRMAWFPKVLTNYSVSTRAKSSVHKTEKFLTCLGQKEMEAEQKSHTHMKNLSQRPGQHCGSNTMTTSHQKPSSSMERWRNSSQPSFALPVTFTPTQLHWAELQDILFRRGRGKKLVKNSELRMPYRWPSFI